VAANQYPERLFVTLSVPRQQLPVRKLLDRVHQR